MTNKLTEIVTTDERAGDVILRRAVDLEEADRVKKGGLTRGILYESAVGAGTDKRYVERAIRESVENKSYVSGELSQSIANYLMDNGYEVGVSDKGKVGLDVIKIFRQREPIQKNLLGIKWEKPQESQLIGYLWLFNEARKARINKKWVLEVCKSEDIQELSKCISPLSKSAKVKLEIELGY
jgi:hypothetical protein